MADSIVIRAGESVLAPPSGVRRVSRSIWRFIREYPLGAIGAFIAIMLILMALVPGVFARQDPDLTMLTERYHGVSWAHWMGQDGVYR